MAQQQIKLVRGMHDILPDEFDAWYQIEDSWRKLAQAYGYRQIRTPILEKTALFHRSIGEVTDIVEKEMYSFEDRGGDHLSLRPEGTASVVRAGIEHGLLNDQQRRLWYSGPMFRRERPQKGRYRQFYQLGAETFGMPGADIEVELMQLVARFWRQIGLQDIELQINTLGTAESRRTYRKILVEYLNDHHDQLDTDSQRRLQSNPLRILDSKNPDMQAMIEAAPKLRDSLDAESAEHFARLQTLLDANGMDYVINPRLVRGLDYYSHTVFEYVTTTLGAQGTVCAGGRYDALVEQLGGKPTTAAGFAMGIERLVLMLQEQDRVQAQPAPDIYFLMVGEKPQQIGQSIAESLRDQLPDLRLITHCGGGSFKSQIKKADKSGATLALILGEDEAQQRQIGIKFLRQHKDQMTIEQTQLAASLPSLLSE